MKKNTKKYLKTNLIGFILGGLLISGVAVYAAITFPSKDVSYSNTASGLESTNVQGAIDELYATCTALPAGEQIIKDNNLAQDLYECRYFFTGANPNNYITFNGETWRIISIGCDSTIKIIRDESIGDIAWDSSNSNNWARPVSLNTYLNGTYYNSLTSTAQSQIVTANYSIGAVTTGNNDLADQVSDENGTTWNGKVSLATLSEYIRTNSNTSSCGTYSLNNNNYSTCRNTTWMYIIDSWWPLSPSPGGANYVFYVTSSGSIISVYPSYANNAVRPVVTLSAEVQITGGDGSQSNPYTIE